MPEQDKRRRCGVTRACPSLRENDENPYNKMGKQNVTENRLLLHVTYSVTYCKEGREIQRSGVNYHTKADTEFSVSAFLWGSIFVYTFSGQIIGILVISLLIILTNYVIMI